MANVLASWSIIVLNGEYSKPVFVERKTLQDGQLGSFRIEAPVVDHRGCSGFAQHRPQSPGLFSNRRWSFALRPAFSQNSPREAQVLWIIFLNYAPEYTSLLDEVDWSLAIV